VLLNNITYDLYMRRNIGPAAAGPAGLAATDLRFDVACDCDCETT